MQDDELVTRFNYHPPTTDQARKYTVIRQQAFELAVLLNDECPESRELSLAMTALEEAVFWGNAAIARRSG